MTSASSRVRCEFCGSRNPRKHWKANATYRNDLRALCCTTCGKARGFWPESERNLIGPNGRGQIA